jgi:hypothetical protein
MDMTMDDPYREVKWADVRHRGAARARLAMMACCVFPVLCACATAERVRESAHDAKAAGELAQDIVAAGLGYKLFLTGHPELGIAYLMLDPLAPNWEIEIIRMSENVFRMQLTMKRYHTGGEGEAQYIFRRNARRLAQSAGYDDYVVLHYEEGLESATSAARRFGEGEIRLIKAQ